MNKDLLNQVRLLKMYVGVLTVALISVFLFSFSETQNKKFSTIDVERINIVEKDGKLKMVIANKELLPPAINNGRVLSTVKGGRGPGMLFYNDAGDECGGYVFGDWGLHFSMDQYKQDQAVYTQVINGGAGEPLRTAGYWVSPQSHLMTSDVMDRQLDSISLIPEKVVRDSARKKFWAKLEKYNKAFMGKTRDDETGLFLFDKDINTRLRAYVDSAGNPKIEFLDRNGNVIYSLPEDKKN